MYIIVNITIEKIITAKLGSKFTHLKCVYDMSVFLAVEVDAQEP